MIIVELRELFIVPPPRSTMVVARLSLLLLAVSHVDSFLSTLPPGNFNLDCVGGWIDQPSGLSLQGKGTELFSKSNGDSKTPSNGDDELLEEQISGITAIASDVDGTLLSSDHTLSKMTKRAIELAVEEVSSSTPNGDVDRTNNNKRLKYFFPATGKSRKGALDSLGKDTRALLENLPGVFIQGLYCVDGNGEVIYEQKLHNSAIVAAEALALEFNTTLIANCRDVIYTNPFGDAKQLEDVNRLWGEPIPTVINNLSDGPEINKLVFMHDDEDLLHSVMRPKLEMLAEKVGASVTTSHITVLELLPKGCSKALGVRKLCEHLGIDPTTELLAMGDAENDIGLLQMAAIGVAMGNASPVAKEAADIVMDATSDEGAAGFAIQRYSCLRDRFAECTDMASV